MSLFLTLAWGSSLFRFIRSLGVYGVFLLGVLDSSFLFLPFGNDFLLIAQISARPGIVASALYVLVAALGSVCGVFLLDLVTRKMGEEGLEKFVQPEKVRQLKEKMEGKAGRAIFVATLLPPPFPFTAAVLSASALQTPRRDILLSVFFGRLLRFTIEAALALWFGKQVLKFLDSDIIDYAVYVFIAIAVVGSIISIRKWFGGGHRKTAVTH